MPITLNPLALSSFRALLIEEFDQFVHPAVQRFRQPEDHRQARHLHTPFELADEGLVRTAEIGERVLREIASGSQLAEALTEDDALRLRLDRHEQISLVFATGE